MLNDGRCECGCRIFFQRPTVITTADGSIRDIPSIMIVECVTCLRVYSVKTSEGRKTLEHFGVGKPSEALLFKAALKDWVNDHTPDRNYSMIVTDPADEVDFERLGIEKPEPAKK